MIGRGFPDQLSSSVQPHSRLASGTNFQPSAYCANRIRTRPGAGSYGCQFSYPEGQNRSAPAWNPSRPLPPSGRTCKRTTPRILRLKSLHTRSIVCRRGAFRKIGTTVALRNPLRRTSCREFTHLQPEDGPNRTSGISREELSCDEHSKVSGPRATGGGWLP